MDSYRSRSGLDHEVVIIVCVLDVQLDCLLRSIWLLFRGGKWTREQAHAFLGAAWDYVGVRS